ncbi:lysophospholipid acyltransferase family protein [Tropicibacter oceani]|uniref:Lysophospholipid acyltransferase family protein n=1 Tax=Tropicibacter oceani TaxID=3058420 RepID=A0ABY8QIY8_9RHOB|nr:lysophospholipid acyltransferase family protein [Tropicibacter oceani]WGW03933.1 lysophospholipid acyltransferase family protein [Tropicibacter oceani]
MLQWIRSWIFLIQMYLAMAVLALVMWPFALFSAHIARETCRAYTRWVRWTAAWMVGLRTEVRGEPPSGAVLVAAKHQSFLDIMLIFGALPSAKFIMKREILWTPFIGLYAWRIGCVAVNRGKRAQAITKMLRDVAKGTAEAGQLIIYPQGTRVAPGVKKPYKVGAAALYKQMQQPCAPVATNVGVFWPRTGVYRKPGLAVVEFLPIIEPGLPQAEFVHRLEHEVESASDALMREAGFHAENPDA